MNKFYFIFFVPVICLLIGRFADLLIPRKLLTTTRRIKLKLFCYNYLPPLLFAMLAVYLISTGTNDFNIFVVIACFVSSILALIFSGRQYLVTFAADKTRVNISYLTPLLLQHSKQFEQADISIMEVTRRNWIADYPAALNITYKKELLEFQVLDQQLKIIVQTALQNI